MKLRFFLALLFVALLQCASATPTVFIVRHAEKAQNDPKDPDLSEAGRRRADSLAALLKDAGITAVYATEFKRTSQTAAPLAHLAHLEVTIVPAGETAALVEKLQKSAGNVLVVAHSNTIPEILQALGLSNASAIGDAEYDNLFVVQPSNGGWQLLRLHHASCPSPD